MENLRYYLPGIIFILLGMLIVFVPEILIAIIASVIILTGLGALYIGHNMRKSEKEIWRTDNGFRGEDFFGRRFVRRSIFRDWPGKF